MELRPYLSPHRYAIAQFDQGRIQDAATGDHLTASVEQMLSFCMQKIRPPMRLAIQRVLRDKKTHCKDVGTIFAAVLESVEEIGKNLDGNNNPLPLDDNTCLTKLSAATKRGVVGMKNFFDADTFRWVPTWAKETRAQVLAAFYLWKRSKFDKLSKNSETAEARDRRDLMLQLLVHFEDRGEITTWQRDGSDYNGNVGDVVVGKNGERCFLLSTTAKAAVQLFALPDDLKREMEPQQPQQQGQQHPNNNDSLLQDWRDRILCFFRNNNTLITQETVTPDSGSKEFARAGDRESFPSLATMRTYARQGATANSDRKCVEKNALQNYWNFCSDAEGAFLGEQQANWAGLLFGRAPVGGAAAFQELRPTLKDFVGHFGDKLTHGGTTMIEKAFRHLGIGEGRVREAQTQVIAEICVAQGRDVSDFMQRKRAARGGGAEGVDSGESGEESGLQESGEEGGPSSKRQRLGW